MRENEEAVPRLLLVEGDDGVAAAESAALTEGGFEIVRVNTGDAALRAVNESHYDLALANLDNLGQGALDFCRNLKDNPALNWMPVMFSTKTITKDTVEKVFEAGADEFVGWPCQPQEMTIRAKALLRKGQEERWLVDRARKLAEKIAERDDELDDLRRFAQDIVSSLSSILLVVDSTQKILFANAPFLSAAHAERRNVVGHKLAEHFDLNAADGNPAGGMLRAIDTALTNGQPSRLRRLNGLLRAHATRITDVTVTAIDFGGIRQVLMVVEDVTEAAIAEAEAMQERAKLHDVVNAMNAALCLIDRDCKIHWQNRTFGLWFGDAFGQPGLQAFLNQMKNDPDWIEQVFGRGQVLNKHWTVFTPHGQRAHFSNIIARIKSVGGEAAQALVLTQDVTEQETRVEQLSLLRELSQILQGTLEAERLYHVILLCCTTGHALGFNRAFLFTRNREMGTLDAQMAVGPANREDAFRIWSELSSAGRSLHDLLRDLTQLPKKEEMPLFPLIRKLRYSLDDSSEIIVRTVLEKKEQVVTTSSNDPRVTPRFRQIFGSAEFVSVPLIVKGAVVGVILADNLYSGRGITDDHVKLMMLFASQAALAIENAETYADLQKSMQSLREAQSQLIQGEKLATVGKMAASVAHEIRNPLSTIGGFANTILRKPENIERVKRSATVIAEEALRLENLLKGVMDFSRPSAPVLKQGDFNAVVEKVFRTQSEYMASRGISAHIDLDRSIPEIHFDENQVMQILHNLIRNGTESMQAGGSLTVKTGRNDESVCLSITDTGTGIPAEIMDRLFDPFFTTKSDGTGLGLAVCKKIIEDHGGRIEVQSMLGKGTTFTICFPTTPPSRHSRPSSTVIFMPLGVAPAKKE